MLKNLDGHLFSLNIRHAHFGKENENIYIIVNHWPSRSGGELGSRPYRNKAAELNMFIIDSIQSINKNAKM